MSTTYAGDRCGCGAFRYAGHRCTGRRTGSGAIEAQTWIDEMDHCISVVSATGLPGRVEYPVLRLLARERAGWVRKLAELEGGGDADE